ncbi:MAG: YeeE/YedE family protein [Eubacteriaceae bacterium]|nr:YeeE/YedE family protein [Eubacteriaceae bacterium]
MASNDLQKESYHSQLSFGIVILILCTALGIILTKISMVLAFYWISGIGFGFILQKSRFCFTASFRDPYLTGSTALTKAVLVALAITTIGFTAIKYISFLNGQVIPGEEYISPIGLSTAIGGLLFGVGMVIAGGCASGVLMRVGEGFQIQIIALIFFVIGSLLGARDSHWWDTHFMANLDGIFLPDVLGWPAALISQLSLIGILYFLAVKWEASQND